MINGNDLHEITGSIMTGLIVGIGSQILLFDNGSTILVRCKYICIVAGDVTIGDGEVLSTAVNVFPLLNNKVLRTGLGLTVLFLCFLKMVTV
ncbi:hypothetical protein N5D61_11800 [Pseudomonas sp. GD03842]|uniref:hypothetical protein n=1 Tax=Pseudomonas sp. GD03842 TaxID=2975385 RepID=UPI00244A8788|nr:hypothetical protein [Pseudomonas sp. GD03842]MDH0747029.1 hypothetical protein [Pseudomonas sp. GD03842]